MIEYILLGLSTLAAIIAIADYFKGFIRQKMVILLLAILVMVSIIFQFKHLQEKSMLEIVAVEMRKNAKSVSDSIVISGWEDSGDYLGYLTQIAGFYNRHSDEFPTEAKLYSAELEDWRLFFSELRKSRGTASDAELEPLEGLVTSGEDHLEQIADEGKS